MYRRSMSAGLYQTQGSILDYTKPLESRLLLRCLNQVSMEYFIPYIIIKDISYTTFCSM